MSVTLYDVVGGADGVTLLVHDLYVRLTADRRVRHHFDPERLPSLEAAQVRWFTACLSGQEPETDLAAVHSHLHITDDQVAAVLGHLDDILLERGASARIRRAVGGIVGRLWYARRF